MKAKTTQEHHDGDVLILQGSPPLTLSNVKKKSTFVLHEALQLERSQRTYSSLQGRSSKGETIWRVTASGMPIIMEMVLEKGGDKYMLVSG